ncbi:cytochrome P450 family protein [Streptomyces sp. URMC 123]|uniref:cytochrome P450 family protein n=1 Tax=Streptomyces sp. URMC 123 TaxID=3423403 RepID=UPI003F1BFCA6
MTGTRTTSRDEIIDLLATYGEAFLADPYPVYAELRSRGPVHRVRSADGYETWLVVGQEEARHALADPRLSKDWQTSSTWSEEAYPPIYTTMLESDPPRHTRLRRLVAREFTGRRVAALRPSVQRLTDDLLDAMLAAPDRRADLVGALAFPLPMGVICELLAVPAMDREAFRSWSNELVAPTGREAEQAAAEAMTDYLRDLIEAKRRTPGDDLMSDLVRAEDDGGGADGGSGGEAAGRLTPDELIGMASLLLIAGHETTVNLIANGVRALLAHPDQLAALRADPGLLDGAVEEMLRYDGPVENATYRFAREPVAIGDVVVPTGDSVLVALAAADRDPGRFADADRFDIRRAPQGHLAFGHGIHYCVGAPLARLEGRIAIGTLLARCPDLALDITGPEALEWLPGSLIRGVRRLPIRW